MQELLAINAALALAEKLLPIVSDLAKSGQISQAEQNDLKTRYQVLRAKADTAFAGPEWEVE